MRHGTQHFKVGCIIALLSIGTNVLAQQDSSAYQVNIGLHHMTHGEVRNGGLSKPQDPSVTVEDRANFILGRTRLSIDYQRKGIEAKAVAQNLAIWGMRGSNSLDLHEAWVKLNSRNGLFAQIGRMALAYDDERILGPNDWAMAALSHDVLRLGYEGRGHKAHAVLAYNQNAENMDTGTFYEDGSQPYKTMQTIWYHYDVPKVPLGASLLFMNTGMQAGTKEKDPHTEWQQLFGGYLSFRPKHFTLEGSYYKQTGKNENAIDIDTWMASIKATVSPADNYGFVAGFDFLSGDDYVCVVTPGTIGLPFHEKIKGFSPIYGSHHQFYGVMDYFYQSAYIQGFTPGLQNAFLGMNYKPLKGLTLNATYHYMAVATSLEKLDMTLGHVIDLEASYNITKDLSLSAGFSFMKGTETMNELKQGNGDSNVRWGWLSFVVSPLSLYSSK